MRHAVDRFYRELEEGGDVHWDDWMERREKIRAQVAALIGAEPDEIAFAPNTSTGMNLIADLVAADGPVLCTSSSSPRSPCPGSTADDRALLPAVEGILRLESFLRPDAPRAATIAISHVQFSNGCRQDLDAFGLIKDDRHLVVSGQPVRGRRSRSTCAAAAWTGWPAPDTSGSCAGYGAGFVFIRGGLLRRGRRARSDG